jgi:hypothetical protein
MPNRVNPSVDRVEPTGVDLPSDRTRGEAKRQELVPSHDPMLLASQLGYATVRDRLQLFPDSGI